jgi:hypothetical protein
VSSSTLSGVGLAVAAVGADMKRTLIVLVVVGLCSPLWGQGLDLREKHRLGAYLTFITITSKDIGGGSPSAEYVVGDPCRECLGLGTVGDGTVAVKCNWSDGDYYCNNGKIAKTGSEPQMMFGGPEITDIGGTEWNWQGVGNPPVKAKREHLIIEHGIEPASVNKMTDKELEAMHNTLHNSEVRSSCPDGNCPTSSAGGGCPSGNCPTSSSRSSSTRRYGLFGRRR